MTNSIVAAVTRKVGALRAVLANGAKECRSLKSRGALGAWSLASAAALGALALSGAPALAQGLGGQSATLLDNTDITFTWEQGDTPAVRIQINSDQGQYFNSTFGAHDYENVSLSVDLDSVLSGWARTGAVTFSGCGAAPLASGTSVVEISNVELVPPATGSVICLITFDAALPAGFTGTFDFGAPAVSGDYTRTGPDVPPAEVVTTPTPFTFPAGAPVTYTVNPDPAPTATLSGPAGPIEPNAFDIAVSFSESVTGLDLSDFTITNASADSLSGGDEGAAANYQLTVTPDGLGTVTVDLPADAAFDSANQGNTAATQYSVQVVSDTTPDVEFTAQFIGGPFDPSETATIRYTLTNNNGTTALTGGSFQHNLNSALSGLAASSLPAGGFCGGSSSAAGTTFLVFSGLEVAASASCTFDVEVDVPGSADPGVYPVTTSALNYTLDGVRQAAAVAPQLSIAGGEGTGAPANFTKAFLSGFAAPGGTIDVQYTIAAPENASTSAMTFTDDMDAALSGLTAAGLPDSDVCGTGSSLSGTSTLTLTGGNLPVGGSCTFTVTLNVPAGAPGGTFTGTTSTLTGTQTEGSTDSALSVAAASDSFQIAPQVPQVVITGPTGDKGLNVPFELTITFSEPVTGFEWTDIYSPGSSLTNFQPVSDSVYTVDVTPNALGARSVRVPQGVAVDADSNPNDISNEFTFDAVAAEPEISVTGLGVEIDDGDSSPTPADGTSFGAVDESAGLVTRTYTIRNDGTGPLSLTGGSPVSLATGAAFSLTQPAVTSLAPGESTTFTVSFDPTAVQSFTDTVSIANDDADENPYSFAIAGEGVAAPEIDITGNGVSISSGDTTPSTADDTDFGSVVFGAGTIARTFTITNLGGADLTLDTPAVSISGLGADDFSLTQPASSTVTASGGTQAFTVTFDPSAVGVANAVISVGNDDSNEDPYTFSVTAEATGTREVELQGGGAEIVAGDTTPSAADGTDFAEVKVGETATASFTILNTGSIVLNLEPAPVDRDTGAPGGTTTVDVVSGSSDFTITAQPSTTVSGGGSTTFTVQYAPSSAGAASAVVAFGSDDLDEPRYAFTVSGDGVTPEIAVAGLSDTDIADGDTTPATADGTDFGSTGSSSGAAITRTFTITNSGDAVLDLGADAVSISGAAAADFTVTTQPDTTVAANGGSTSFVISFDPSAEGAREAGVSIANDDDDESPFTFDIAGTGADDTAPAGYTVAFTTDPVFAGNETAVGFSFTGAEPGATYDYEITSDGGSGSVTGNGAIVTATDAITGIDVSGLADGTLTVSATLTDAASNEGDAATDTVLKDTVAPTVTLSTASSDPVSGSFTLDIEFSESVAGLLVSELSLSGATASGLSGSGDTYSVTLAPAGDGTITVDLPAGAAQDAAGNGNTAAAQFSIESDSTAPTVTIDSSASDPVSGVFSVSIEFSESVTGFTLGDITVGGGSPSNLAGSGASYTADITPSGDGAVTVDVAAGAAQDAAGNGNTAATQFSIESDGTAPGVVIASVASSPVPGPFRVTITFDEQVSGFTSGDVVIGNGSVLNFTNADGLLFQVDILPSADGTVTVDVAAGVAQDAAGNDNTAATQFSIESDSTAPGVVISTASADPVSGVFSVTFTFDEAVTGFEVGDISVGNGSASNFAGSGDTYTADITPTADGTVTVNVAGGVAQDAAGNANTAAAQFSIESDSTAPSVTINSSASDPVSGVFSVSIEFSESVTGFAVSEITVGGGSATNLAGSGTSYTADITPSGDGTVTVNVAAGVAEDAAGNGNTAAAQFSIEADATAPTVTITTASSDPVSGAFSITATFSEDVSGFGLGDIQVDNGAASNLAGSGAVYTADISPDGDGTVTVNIPAGAATDAAGNASIAADAFVIENDETAPGVILSTQSADPVSGPFTLAITFTEPVTGFALGDLVLANATASDLTGTGAAYTATLTPAADGAITADLPAGAATDAAGNPSTAAAQFAIESDSSAPTVQSITVSDADLRLEDVGDTFTLTVTFSEPVDPNAGGAVTLDADLTATLSTTDGALNTDNTAWVLTATVLDGGQSIPGVTVEVTGFADAAGNTIADVQEEDLFAVEMRRAGLVVSVEIDGSVDDTFAFTGDLGGFDITTANQSGQASFADLAEGNYAFAVGDLEGYILDTLSCTGVAATTDPSAGSASVSLAPGESGTCVYALTAEAGVDPDVEISVPLVLPSDFSDPSAVSAQFPLTNVGGEALDYRIEVDVNWLTITPAEGSIAPGETVQFTVAFNDNVLDLEPGVYTATIRFFNLASGGSGAAGDLSAQAANTSTVEIPVTVEIVERFGSLTLIATTAPDIAGEGDFAFTSDIADVDGAVLATSGGAARLGPLDVERGQYSIAQIAPEGWRLESISCAGDSDGGSVVDVEAGSLALDLDPEEQVICTFANVRDEAYVRRITTSAIRDFMAQRADQILTQSPKIGDRLRRGRAQAANGFSADFTAGRFDSAFALSLSGMREAGRAGDPFAKDDGPAYAGFDLSNAGAPGVLDVWIQASYSGVDDDRAGLNSRNRFGLVYLGADLMINEDLLAGVLIQYDRMETETGPLRSQVEGDGWMAGPYVAMRIGENLYFDARGAWGRSDNTINPLGLYSDDFETDRWLLEANLAGDVFRGAWRITPEAGVAWFSEDSEAYVDSLGIDIPGQSVTLGRVRFGPEIAYRFVKSEQAYIEPYVSLQAIYNFDEAEVLNATGVLEGLFQFRADARLGLNAAFDNGARLSGELTVNGIGEGDLEATGAMIRLRTPLAMP